jgi:hypothetical protein
MTIVKIIVIVLSVLCSLLFIACLPAIGNKEKGLKIHKEMPHYADAMLVDIKGIITFITGLAYLAVAAGLIFNIKILLWIGFSGSVLFVLFYFIEIALWVVKYPLVLGGFLMFGTLSILIGGFSIYSIYNS